MKLKDYILLIAIGISTFLIINNQSDEANLSQLEKQNSALEKKIDSLSTQMDSSFANIKIINEKKEINRNYYISKENEIETITDIDSLRDFIRVQLLELGSTRF